MRGKPEIEFIPIEYEFTPSTHLIKKAYSACSVGKEVVKFQLDNQDQLLVPATKPFIYNIDLIKRLQETIYKHSLFTSLQVAAAANEHLFALFDVIEYKQKDKTILVPHYHYLIATPKPYDDMTNFEKSYIKNVLLALYESYNTVILQQMFFLKQKKLNEICEKMKEIAMANKDVLYIEGLDVSSDVIFSLVFYKMILTYSLNYSTDVVRYASNILPFVIEGIKINNQ